MTNYLHAIFNPRSVAIIGASETPGKLGERRTRSLIEGGYASKIFLINSKRNRLFNRKAYSSILEISEQVDFAMIIVPVLFIPQVVTDCVKMGVRGIVIMTAGFSEIGEKGKMLEDDLLSIVKQGRTKLIGPNSNGIFSDSVHMNLLGVPKIKSGSLSIIAQSGNIIVSLSHYAQLRNIGFSKIISIGNAIDIKLYEYLEFLSQDEQTKVILLYLEEIEEGNKFVQVAREVSKNKPIVALKVGRSKTGVRAAASHTGSITGDDDIVDAAFKQAGIIRVFNVDELFDVATCLATLPRPQGKKVAILSEGGGDYSVASDNAEKYGFTIPVLPEKTQDMIRPFILQDVSACNPIDYGATAEERPEDIHKIVKVLMEEKSVDSFYITGFYGGYKEIVSSHIGELENKTSHVLGQLMNHYQKPIVVHTSFGNEPVRSLDILREHRIFVTASSDRAAECLNHLSNFALKKSSLKKAIFIKSNGIYTDKARNLIKKIAKLGRYNLLETEARELLDYYDIPLPQSMLVTSSDEAIKAALKISFPVALKIVSPDILHKSDIGGVILNVKTELEVKQAYEKIIQNTTRKFSPSKIVGVLVSPMAPKGQECIIGMVKDPQFGPVMMFGLGGIFVEVLKDVSFRVSPLTDLDTDEMIKEIQGYPLLTGLRGEAAKDIRALKDTINRISQLALDHPEIQEIDLNPVIAQEKGISIVDVRIIITK
ncbi:MAG: acetate--CoA ligase family protein [Candidatus Hodarchaeales archaeon]|jgi:acetyltransferase